MSTNTGDNNISLYTYKSLSYKNRESLNLLVTPTCRKFWCLITLVGPDPVSNKVHNTFLKHDSDE